MTKNLAVLSPYAYPRLSPRIIIRNVGDGFILRAIERHLGRFPSGLVMSSRAAPTPAQVERLLPTDGVILGGANQLQDNFAPWPGLNAETIRKDKLRFIPMGVGVSGKPGGGIHFTAEALKILEVMHERIEYSSWRCPRTVAYLEDALPHLKGQFLMTCCPVLLDKPLLDGTSFHDRSDTIAVTITDRDDFWERELPMLKSIAQQFPKSRRILSLHQDFAALRGSILHMDRLPFADGVSGTPTRFRRAARELGYEIKVLRSAEQGIAFYRDTVDLHFGSRLHAHLLMMSLNKKSFLISVDERMAGISEFLGFPMCDPNDVLAHLDFDFEIVRRQARIAHTTMQKFISRI